MSTPEQGSSPARPAAAAPASGVTHPRSFKLRFAARRVPGHSYISAIRPLGMPALLTDKWWSRAAPVEAGEERALCRARALFARGPRDIHERPVLSSHEYGWWTRAPAARGDRRLHHHIRDSAWLKSRVRVLAADAHAPRRR